MTTLHFNFRDLFRSVKLAFSLQRIWIQFVGLSVSYPIYLILAYLAFISSGEGIKAVWDRYGLLPMLPGTYMPVISIILYALAIFFLIYGAMITATGVARAVYMNLKGNTFYTWKEALGFAWKKKLSILGTPLALTIFIIIIVICGYITGLIGRIPYFGEWFISLFTIFWFLASLFVILIGIALTVSFLLTPAILATTDDDAFEGVFQSFSIAFTQPWRLLVYQVLNLITAMFGFVTFTLLFKYAWKVLNLIISWGMGEKFVRVASAASYYVQSWTYPFVLCYQSVLGDYGQWIFYSHDFISVAVPVRLTVAALIMAFGLIVLGLYVVSFPIAILNSGQTLCFLAIKKIKDDENLLERKDREEEEESEETESEPDAGEASAEAEKEKE
jgi:hypothetical protein